MEAGNFTDNIESRTESVQNIHFYVLQPSSKKGGGLTIESSRDALLEELEQTLQREEVPLLALGKPSYNLLMQAVFNQYNAKYPGVKAQLIQKIDLMVDEYVAKNIGVDNTNHNVILTLNQLAGEIVQRRSGLHNQLFSMFFARMLNDQVRQIVWKAALVIYDPIIVSATKI